MIGTLLNTAAILAGGIVGLTAVKDLSRANQMRIKVFLGVFTVYLGLSLAWKSVHGGIFSILKQFVVVLLALVLGNIIGKLLKLQERLNRLGRYAKEQFSRADAKGPNRFSEGFVTCSILYCVGPIAILGALQDGLTGNFKLLAIKSVMDGLATMAFAKTFGWGVLFSAIPVMAYQGTITLGAEYLQTFLQRQELLDSINATGGLLMITISLVILDLRKVPLADYLPSLAVAPLLTWIWR